MNLSKPINKMILSFIFVIISLVIAFITGKYGKNNYEDIKIKYKEKSNIEYKVYLKENDFFEEDFLEMNKTYITSLIDYIDVNFNYELELDDVTSGSYSYYIKGVISADKTNGQVGSYWSKEYKLTNTITKTYENVKNIDIDTSIDVNYEKYNKILASFKNEYGISANGKLKIVLVVNNTVDSDKIDRDITKKSSVELNIPLTSLTIEVPIEKEDLEKEEYLVNEKIKSDDIFHKIARITGHIFYCLSNIFTFYLLILTIKEFKKESIYQKKLRKILKTYDSILVETKQIPNLNKYDIISVKTFEELIDAHSELRRPINFVQKLDSVKFLLISEGIVWIYTLERNLFKKEDWYEKIYKN